jgi:preprotein translocase subunit SecG
MLYFFLVLIIIACVLLTLVILVQNPKGGGIAGGALGTQATQFLGARQTTDFLEKATWYFGIGILVIVFVTYFMTVSPSGENTKKAKVSSALDYTPPPSAGAKPSSPGAIRTIPAQPSAPANKK